jgi:thiamine-monophosphate kinase
VAPPSEFALIDRHFRRPPRQPGVRLGVGDDAAVIAVAPGTELAISVDMLVEGRHFLPGANAGDLGHKVLAVNLSDLAAMGALPRYALLAGALPDPDEGWLAAFMRGFRALAERYEVDLIGGDTTRGPRNLCVTVIGEVAAGRAITRSGARAEDDVYVSGMLGAAALAVRAQRGDIDLDARTLARLAPRLDAPEPRVLLGRALAGVASAALDLSDGLTGDLGHILAASACAATIRLAALPLDPAVAALLDGPHRALALDCALAGGDDYELCFTAPPGQRQAVEAAARDGGVACTRIGRIAPGRGLRVLDEQEAAISAPAAFDHFA